MKKTEHPYLRLVYTRPDVSPDPTTVTIIQAVPSPNPSWPPESAGCTTIAEFMDELRRFVEKETAAER